MTDNLIIFPTDYEGERTQEAEYAQVDDLTADIRLMCSIPEIKRVLKIQLDSIQKVFKKHIDNLKHSESGSSKFTTGDPELDDYLSYGTKEVKGKRVEIIDLQNNIQNLSLEKKIEFFLDIFERVPEIQKRILNIFYNQILPYFDNNTACL